MNLHLSDEQLNGWILGERDTVAAAHVEVCAACRAELERSCALLAGYGEQARLRGQRDEFFWMRQRALIRSRIPARMLGMTNGMLRWASATVAATLLAAVLLLQHGQAPPTQPIATTDAADEALPLGIQSDVGRPAP